MIGIRQVMEVVEDYLVSDDLDSFIAKFAAVSHNIHRKGDPSAIALCESVESLLAALYAGVESPKFLHEHLQKLGKEPVVFISHSSFEQVGETYAPAARVEELAYS
jgi:hypothetical protein